MNIKKLFIGLTVVAMALSVSVAGAQTLTADQIMQALLANPTLLAQLSSLLGGSTAGSAVTSAPLAPLTIGSKGAQVTALQNFLLGQGISIPAGATGYFGGQTQAAVKAFQIANNITPALGYYGNLTAAAVAAKIAVVVPPVGTTLPAGCVPGALFSSTTAQPCTPTTPGPISGGTEGSIAASIASTPPQTQANVRSQNDVSALGIKVEGIASDMTVDRADLQIGVTPVGGSAQNPGSFVNKVSFYDGSTLLKEVAVSTSDFLKDSSDRYHLIVTAIGFKVPKNTIKVLTVKLSVNSINSTDSNRTVTVQGYAGNTNNIRATDTAGFQSYADMSGTANTATLTFKPAGASTVTITLDNALTPKAANNRVSTTNGVEKLTMMGFSAKAETGDAKITKMYIASNATTTAGLPSTLYLTDESGTVLGSVAAGATDGAEKLISGLSIVIPQDTTKRFLIKADFPTTANGQQASSSLMTNSVQWEKPDGSTASTTPSSEIAGNDQYFNSAVPKWTFVSGSVDPLVVLGTSAPATTTATYHMTLKAQAMGGSITKPVLSDFTIRFASSTAATYTTANATSTAQGDNVLGYLTDVQPSYATVDDGGEYTVTLTGILRNKNSQGVNTITGPYFMVVTSAQAVVGGNTVTQTWNLSDFKTPPLTTPSGY